MPLLPLLISSVIGFHGALNPFGDDDNDGLLNCWETDGFGPLDPKKHGCNPLHSDIIVCMRIRPGMTEATMGPTIERMKKFYAEMPHKNPDGTTGLHMIPVILPPLEAQYNNKGYTELYDVALPQEWRGLGHGVLVDNSPGGGGQANRPDWCGTGYNAWTMLHELGHQLGLPHEPRNSGLGSPFHTSLMNYDYSYQLDGSADKVHFSTGEFSSLKLHEADLDENIPFSAESLHFLTQRPHFFTVKAVDKNHCMVDFNRNGILGEKHVRADINDGYSAGYDGINKGEKTVGAPVMVSTGKELLLLTLQSASADLAKADAAHPAKMVLSRIVGDKQTKIADLGIADVASDLSAVFDGKSIHVGYSTKPGSWSHLIVRPDGSHDSPILVAGGSDPCLAQLPSGLAAVVRASDGELSLVSLSQAGATQDLKIKSTQPAGATWNPKKNVLAVVTVEDRPGAPGVLRVNEFSLAGSTWTPVAKFVVGGDQNPARTSSHPLILTDTTSPKGLYKVWCKGYYPDPNQPGLNFLCRQTAAGTGWWIKMMGNEWANSRSVCGIAPHGDDISYAYRWFSGPEDNMVWGFWRASGIDKGVITDFDEVSFIFEHGLRDSLNAVRNEQWPRKGWK